MLLLLLPVVYAPAVSTISNENTDIEIVAYPFQNVKVNEPMYIRFWAFNGSSGIVLTNSSIYCTLNHLEPLGRNKLRVRLGDSNFDLKSPDGCRNCFWYNMSAANNSYRGINAINLRCQTHDNISLGGNLMMTFDVGDSIHGSVDYETMVGIDNKYNLEIFIAWFAIILVLIAYMHKFKEDEGSSIVFGWFGATFAWLLGAIMIMGWKPINTEMTFILNVNSDIALIIILLGVYSAIYSVLMRREKRGTTEYD